MNENYFILLGLSFDPVEDNEEIIQEAIDKKILEWQKDAKNPRKAVIAKEYLQNIDTIKETMFDEQSRNNHAFQARAIHDKKLKEAYYEALIKGTKGYLKTSDLKEIAEKYSSFGIKEEHIKAKIDIPVYNDELLSVLDGEGSFEVIDSGIANQLETYFENIGQNNVSIYEFFETSEETSNEDMCRIADEKLKFVLQKGSKDTIDEITQKISGIAKNIFISDEERTKYDNYLKGCKYPVLNNLIQGGANSNEGNINVKLYNLLINIMSSDFNLSKEEGTNYIAANAAINGFKIDKEVLDELSKPPEVMQDEEDDFEDLSDPQPQKAQPSPVPTPQPTPKQEQLKPNNPAPQQPVVQEQTKETKAPIELDTEKTPEEMSPEELKEKNPVEYVNKVLFQEHNIHFTSVMNEEQALINEVSRCKYDATYNQKRIPSGQGGLKFTIVVFFVGSIINFLLNLLLKNSQIGMKISALPLVHLIFCAGSVIFLLKNVYHYISTKKLFDSEKILKTTYNESKNMIDRDYSKKKWNEVGDGSAEDIIEYVQRLRKKADAQLEHMRKNRNAFFIAINKFTKTNNNYYLVLGNIIEIVVTIGLTLLLLK